MKILKSQEEYKPLVPYMPADPTPGHSYTPYQVDPEYFDVDEAFANGTLFPALAQPYPGKTIGREVY